MYKNIQIRVSESDHATVKHFNEILKFPVFVKQTLSHIFDSQNGSCVLKLNKNTQTRFSESGPPTVKYFTEIVAFKMFLKTTLSQFSFLKVVLINEYD